MAHYRHFCNSSVITAIVAANLLTMLFVFQEFAKNDFNRPQHESRKSIREEEWVTSKEKEATLSLISRVCSSEMVSKFQQMRPIIAKQFVFDGKKRVAMCKNAKVSSSTWLAHFVQISEVIPEEKKKHLLSNDQNLHWGSGKFLTPSNDSQIFADILAHNQIFLFSFVRHPFDRLASAYRDKILYRRDPWFYPLADKLANQSHAKVASFETFLKHVLKDPFGNKHWLPFHLSCNYCELKYDFIGKMEKFNEDAKYVFAKMGIGEELKLNVKRNGSKGEKKSGDSSKRLFAKVSSKTKQKVYELYKIDFLMFNYSGKDYFG